MDQATNSENILQCSKYDFSPQQVLGWYLCFSRWEPVIQLPLYRPVVATAVVLLAGRLCGLAHARFPPGACKQWRDVTYNWFLPWKICFIVPKFTQRKWMWNTRDLTQTWHCLEGLEVDLPWPPLLVLGIQPSFSYGRAIPYVISVPSSCLSWQLLPVSLLTLLAN